MDKIQKRLPIRAKKIKSPVVFTFNILLNHYLAFKTSHYSAIQRIIQKQNNVDNFYLLPNITNVAMTLDERAKLLAENLQQLHKKLGLHQGSSLEDPRLHVITHSFCGVDMRAALSLCGAGRHVKSLSTVCSPHHGMKLVDQCEKYELFELANVEKAIEACGLSQQNAQEFTSYNIKDFNTIAQDHPQVDYFSIGAQKQQLQSSDVLRHGFEAISEGMIQNRSDGLVMPEEAKWGHYLVTYEQDHLEMAGFIPEYTPISAYTLLVDNIRLCEAKNDASEAKEFGVDHLFEKRVSYPTQSAGDNLNK